jgi:hypothetical protein
MIDPELNLLTAIIIVLNVNIHSMICGVEYEVRSLVVIVWPGDGWVTCEKKSDCVLIHNGFDRAHLERRSGSRYTQTISIASSSRLKFECA